MFAISQDKYYFMFSELAPSCIELVAETAINIGYSCQLITDEMADIFIVDGHTYDDVETQLSKFRESVRSAGLGHGGAPTGAAASAPTSVSIVTFRWDQHR